MIFHLHLYVDSNNKIELMVTKWNYGFQRLVGRMWDKRREIDQRVQTFSYKVNKFVNQMYSLMSLVNNNVL